MDNTILDETLFDETIFDDTFLNNTSRRNMTCQHIRPAALYKRRHLKRVTNAQTDRR